jgi:hypothetical protein
MEPTPQDTAQYTVQAKNSVGFAETTATVVVEGNKLVFVCKHILCLKIVIFTDIFHLYIQNLTTYPEFP